MIRRDTWITRQLEAASDEARSLPDWARREAGLKTLSPSDSPQCDEEPSDKKEAEASQSAPASSK